MSDEPPRPDPYRSEPDRAALDELLRAFGAHHGGVAHPEGVRDEVDTAHVTDVVPPDPGSEPTEAATDDELPLDDDDELPVDDDDELPVDDDDELPVVDDDDDETAVDDEAIDLLLDDTRPAPPPTPPTPSTRPGTTVISIDDDDLPDAVYVEGSLDDSGDRSVVFIDDDDTGDAVVPEAAGTLGRGIEPRFRERRIAVRRAEGRRRLRWFVVVGAVLVLVVAVLAVLGSPLFSVEEVRVTGAVYTDPERLQAVIDDLEGTPVLLVDTAATEREIEAIPWVDEATVRANFPRTVTIEIDEREALATYQGPDQRFRVIDRDGRVLDVLDGQPIAYMLVTGPDAADLEPGAFAPPGYAAAAELVQGLTASVRGQVESIDVTADGSQLRMFLEGGLEVRFGAATDLLTKLVRLETVLAQAVEVGASVIDVSTAEVTIR